MRNFPLVIGQVVETARSGRAVVTAIHGIQKPSSIKSIAGIMVTGGNAEFDLVYYSGVRTYKVPESIVCGGLAWTVHDIVVPQNEIEDLVKAAIEREQKEAQEQAAQAAAFALEKCRLKECPEYKHLKKLEDNKGSECAMVAANIRKELKIAFPGVKFSVTSRHYTSVNIKWTDGPIKEEVKKITSKYKSGHFNGMEDIYEYNTSAFNEIYGSVQYIFEERHYSDEIITKAIEKARAKFGVNCVPEFVTVELYRDGGTYNIGREYLYNGLDSELHRLLSEMKG